MMTVECLFALSLPIWLTIEEVLMAYRTLDADKRA